MRLLFLLTLNLLIVSLINAQQPVWKSEAFTVYADSIVQQHKYTATALSSTAISSDYKSPANAFRSPQLTFKFSINGKDNEMAPGKDHHYNYLSTNGSAETPVIKFGEQYNEQSKIPDNVFLPANAKLKIRLDMREVLSAFNDKGYFSTYKGDKIYKEDFKGVYVAGNSSPLIWDFDNLVNHPQLQLKDADGDGIYEADLLMNAYEEKSQTAANRRLTKDITAFPQYKSGYPIADALYNMSIEEMIRAIEKDSTFRTGKEWAGVWTRDISYSIILSMAHLQPKVAKNSLLRKVNKNGRIIQDTGTGGAWPCSTDRMIWAVAAWELYKVTGDKDWLQQAYLIITNSIDDDLFNVYDKETGLVKGESSFLDWREETYPKWMQPADIFESECLGTNAVHYEANIVLAQMASVLKDGKAAEKYQHNADQIKNGINKYLWIPSKGYFGQFLYGRNFKILSERSEALGEALCVIFNIADDERQKQILQNTPVTAFGIPCIFPNIPGIPPYHNNAVWPFVQTYWLWAAAKAGNETSAMQSIASIYRPAAMFLTNKENFVAEDGDFLGTQINSSNMLWSLSGNISIVHKVIFGIRFNADDLSFQPFVPKAFQGKRSLDNFSYRNAILDIEMEGYGNKIKSFQLDGKTVADTAIPSTLTGRHTVKITLANNTLPGAKTNLVANSFTPAAPVVNKDGTAYSWQAIPSADKYKVLKNGKLLLTTKETKATIVDNAYAEYQVIAIDKNGVSSFASEPIIAASKDQLQEYQVERFATKSTATYKGFSGDGFVEIAKQINTSITIPVTVNETGLYAIDFRYANGNGPTNTENKCAIRSLKTDAVSTGTFVFPQRGRDEWSNWGFSNSLQVQLTKGTHNITLSFEPYNENMNEVINQAMLDYMRVIKLK